MLQLMAYIVSADCPQLTSYGAVDCRPVIGLLRGPSPKGTAMQAESSDALWGVVGSDREITIQICNNCFEHHGNLEKLR